VLPVQTFVRHMKVAAMDLSGMERPAFQKQLIFRNLPHRTPCASICIHLNEFTQLDPLRPRPLFTSEHIENDSSRKAVEKHLGT
jgi:hypothetical protein